jgi:hypothetical protein
MNGGNGGIAFLPSAVRRVMFIQYISPELCVVKAINAGTQGNVSAHSMRDDNMNSCALLVKYLSPLFP